MSARILVVDDLLPNRRLLEAKLKSEYYEVSTAENGLEAIAMANQSPPDIVLLDVMMPEMDGFETCRQLKSNPKTAQIPVVMVTALSDLSDRLQGLESGADDFLTKPINDLALFARIRSLVRLKTMLDELKIRNRTGEEFGLVHSEDSINTDNSRVLLVDDDEMECQQMTEHLAPLHIEVEHYSNPHDAVKRTSEVNFDLIIISSQLIGDDPLHLSLHLRSQEQTRTTPLLLMIDEDNNDLLVRGLDMGINDYIVAPIDGNEVVARVKTQIKRKRYQDALKASYEENISMAVMDSLTGLHNRRYFDTHINNMFKQSLQTGKPLSLMMIDLDHFKSVNDTYGHQAGDAILKQAAQLITRSVRATDLTARYGGEEFAVIMPDTHIRHAADVGQRIRNAFVAKEFILPNDTILQRTASIGISSSVSGDNVQGLIERADKALYKVKESGRNNVAVYNIKPPSESGGGTTQAPSAANTTPQG